MSAAEKEQTRWMSPNAQVEHWERPDGLFRPPDQMEELVRPKRDGSRGPGDHRYRHAPLKEVVEARAIICEERANANG